MVSCKAALKQCLKKRYTTKFDFTKCFYIVTAPSTGTVDRRGLTNRLKSVKDPNEYS